MLDRNQDDRRSRAPSSRAVAEAHDDWVTANSHIPPAHPENYRKGSDYLEHYLDVNSTPEMEADFQGRIHEAAAAHDLAATTNDGLGSAPPQGEAE
jgi:hypothetical protein